MSPKGQSKFIEYFHRLFASGLFTGHLPKAPGTWGSALAALILWFVWPAAWYYQALVLIAAFPFVVYFADNGIRYYGPDGHPIVIDEIYGQAITLFMAPHNILAYIIGFFLFRLFDIVKPSPAREWEKLQGGYGIVADDMAAGVYAAIVLEIIIVLSRKVGLEIL
jgi:phosphatidylglycerophosphatase A